MPRLTKRQKEMWAFFLHPKTGRRTYNDLCRSCLRNCKQSFRAVIIECPRYFSKRAEYYARKHCNKMAE